MTHIIIRIEVLSDEYMQKYNLYCKKRIVYFDFNNKLFSSCGVPENAGISTSQMLKSYKCRFKRKKLNMPSF